MSNSSGRSSELTFLLKHSSIYGIGVVLSRAVAFLMLPLYTRHLTPGDYGMLDLVETTTGLVGIVAGLGIVTSITRFYYEYQQDEERHRLISTVYIMIAVCSAALLAMAQLAAPTLARLILDDAKYASYFQVAFASLLVGIIVDVGLSYLRMIYKSVLFITLSITSLVIGVFLNVLFVAKLNYGVLGILSTSLIVRLIVGIPLTGVILYRVGLRFSGRDARVLLSYSIPLLPATLGTALMNYSDRYFVKHFTTIADVGAYGLANKLGGVLHALVTSPFIMTFQPRRFQVAQEHADGPGVFRMVFDAFFFALLFLSLCLSMFVPEIMVMMTTPAFYSAGPLVPLLLLNMLIFGMKYHVDFGILHSRKTHYYMWINIVTAVVQIAGAFTLTKFFGVWGAAFAGLLSVTVNATLLQVFSEPLYPIKFNFGRAFKMLALAVVVYFWSAYLPVHDMWLTVPIKLLLLAGYVVALPLFGIVSPSEMASIRSLTRTYVSRLNPA